MPWLTGTFEVACEDLLEIGHASRRCLKKSDLRIAGGCLSVVRGHHGHGDQSRKGRGPEAKHFWWSLSHNLPRHGWQPQASGATAGEAPSDLALAASRLEQAPRLGLRGCNTVNRRSTRPRR